MGENQVTQQIHLQPNHKAPPQEETSKLEPERLPHPPRVQSPDGRRRSANLRQLGVEPEKGSQLHDTQRKTADAPGKRQSSHTKRGSARAYPTPSRRRGRHSSAATERKKETLHTSTGTTRAGGPELEHTSLATAGEREAQNRQTEQKRLHQNRSLGIEARNPQASAKTAKLGKKPPHRQHCASPAEEPEL